MFISVEGYFGNFAFAQYSSSFLPIPHHLLILFAASIALIHQTERAAPPPEPERSAGAAATPSLHRSAEKPSSSPSTAVHLSHQGPAPTNHAAPGASLPLAGPFAFPRRTPCCPTPGFSMISPTAACPRFAWSRRPSRTVDIAISEFIVARRSVDVENLCEEKK
uniref:Uncharacterized protein n=1 Tax=Oryza nivara TaxID=4536 RepID=A0A0E0H2Q4_ORYNI